MDEPEYDPRSSAWPPCSSSREDRRGGGASKYGIIRIVQVGLERSPAAEQVVGRKWAIAGTLVKRSQGCVAQLAYVAGPLRAERSLDHLPVQQLGAGVAGGQG